ncbi:hypothetical protein BDV98DRAFT_516055 [Pterulicium gracile]|uniref:Protein kinase domain-containing protein n=1 Tax=Pterulicium gracile TaxID=1884261 RepID=A0A5C3Q562_9AGAR|nr:hypothetical protein BDV98DRAFT_516055 [Pterula gracilis]
MGSSLLGSTDNWWRDIYYWLLERGYTLRPCYHPDWIPSWKGTKKLPSSCKDGLGPLTIAPIVDATRISDGTRIILKQGSKALHPHEREISTFLSSEELRNNPRNHSVPVLEILDPSEEHFLIVMPLLRSFWDPRFETIGEVVGYIRQLFERTGMCYLPSMFVTASLSTFRDCKADNIVIDAHPMYPNAWHPVATRENAAYTKSAVHVSRTAAPEPIKYYFIDLGIAVRFRSTDSFTAPLIRSGDKSVPKYQPGVAHHDHFPTDVHLLGNTIKECFHICKMLNLQQLPISLTGLRDLGHGLLPTCIRARISPFAHRGYHSFSPGSSSPSLS